MTSDTVSYLNMVFTLMVHVYIVNGLYKPTNITYRHHFLSKSPLNIGFINQFGTRGPHGTPQKLVLDGWTAR